MKNLTPRHIQEAESDRRSIKDGWYAINKSGQVRSGRFSNREDCQAHIEQETTRNMAVMPKERRLLIG
jgi:hypothetical protein